MFNSSLVGLYSPKGDHFTSNLVCPIQEEPDTPSRMILKEFQSDQSPQSGASYGMFQESGSGESIQLKFQNSNSSGGYDEENEESDDDDVDMIINTIKETSMAF